LKNNCQTPITRFCTTPSTIKEEKEEEQYDNIVVVVGGGVGGLATAGF